MVAGILAIIFGLADTVLGFRIFSMMSQFHAAGPGGLCIAIFSLILFALGAVSFIPCHSADSRITTDESDTGEVTE